MKYCVLKNILGAIGLACYCWGTTAILGRFRSLLIKTGDETTSSGLIHDTFGLYVLTCLIYKTMDVNCTG